MIKPRARKPRTIAPVCFDSIIISITSAVELLQLTNLQSLFTIIIEMPNSEAIVVSCCSCGYPIAATYIGEEIKCPFCGQKGKVKEEESMLSQKTGQYNITNGGVTIPTWLFAGVIGVIIGGVFTPSIMAATEAGSRKLAELSRQYIEKKGR
jgi:predicted RNA-binding Zn-ribbon protein involved in translation (DUF1610 family)